MPEDMTARKPYPSDLSDARWALVEPTLTAWRQRERRAGLRIGRPPRHDLRCILDAILYVDRTGIPWRYLPHEYPPHQTVYYYFARWQEDGVFEQLSGLLRRLVRIAEGRDPEPTACVIDSQSVKTAATVPAATQGTDAGKKIIGRKRNIITDTLGLLLVVLVTAASVQDGPAGLQLLAKTAAAHPSLRKAWADSAYRTTVIEHAATLGIDLEVIRRDPATRGFTPLPRRWGRGADLRLADALPPPGPRLRSPARPIRSHDPPRHDRPHDPPLHPRIHPNLARHLIQTRQNSQDQTPSKRIGPQLGQVYS
jgi:transposase